MKVVLVEPAFEERGVVPLHGFKIVPCLPAGPRPGSNGVAVVWYLAYAPLIASQMLHD